MRHPVTSSLKSVLGKAVLGRPVAVSVRTPCGRGPLWAPICPPPPSRRYCHPGGLARGPLLQAAGEKRGSSDTTTCGLCPTLAAKLWRGLGASPRPARPPVLAFCPQEAGAACHGGSCPLPAGLGTVTLNPAEARHNCPSQCPQLRPWAGERGHSGVAVKFAAFWDRDAGGRGRWEVSVRST